VDLSLRWRDESWTLLGERALWRERTRALILSDVHLGKAHDFQAAGVAVPATVHDEDFSRWAALLKSWSPKRVLILGDLVHSHWQPYPDLAAKFAELRRSIVGGRFTLVLGNHDVRARPHLEEWGFDDITNELDDDGLTFAHDALGSKAGVRGHVHPVVRLKVGADRLRLPCFVIGKKHLLLPAFGAFTGGYDVRPHASERVFAIAGREVVAVPAEHFR
jgi:DNA ligase-associated metallophosphoesterase